MSKNYNFYVYILTNFTKTTLYVGVTSNLKRRISEHEKRSVNSFTSKYKCFFLIYFEWYQYINDAIEREKEIKGWTRAKKMELIKLENKDLRFLNDEIMET